MSHGAHTGNPTFDQAVASIESMYQNSVAGTPSQATVNAAEIVFYRARKALEVANGINTAASVRALLHLGTGGA